MRVQCHTKQHLIEYVSKLHIMSDSDASCSTVQSSSKQVNDESTPKNMSKVAKPTGEKKTSAFSHHSIMSVTLKYKHEISSEWTNKGQISGLTLLIHYLVLEEHLNEIPEHKMSIVRIILLNILMKMNIPFYQMLILNSLGKRNRESGTKTCTNKRLRAQKTDDSAEKK